MGRALVDQITRTTGASEVLQNCHRRDPPTDTHIAITAITLPYRATVSDWLYLDEAEMRFVLLCKKELQPANPPIREFFWPRWG